MITETHTTEGWAIIDRRGRPWGKMIFSSLEAARRTAEAYMTEPYKIAGAARVEWQSTRPGNRIPTLHERWIIREEAK